MIVYGEKKVLNWKLLLKLGDCESELFLLIILHHVHISLSDNIVNDKMFLYEDIYKG